MLDLKQAHTSTARGENAHMFKKCVLLCPLHNQGEFTIRRREKAAFDT